MIKNRICQHLRMLHIPKTEAARFSSLIQKWVDCNGLEWTASRLKSLRQSFIASLESDGIVIPAEGWAVRTNRHGKLIYSDGLVHRILTMERNERSLKLIEGFLRSYQVLVLDTPSDSQIKKMESAITGDPISNLILVNIYDVEMSEVSRPGKTFPLRLEREVWKRVKTLPELLNPSSIKTSPAFVNIDSLYEIPRGIVRLKSFKRSDYRAASFLSAIQLDKDWNSLWKKYPKEFGQQLMNREDFPVSTVETSREELLNLPVGNVSILQSDGCKARWVANPMLFVQSLGEPLKVKLLRYSSEYYPEIMTTDQTAAHERVVSWLRDGRKVWSFDATSFTDRFPWSFQKAVLDNLLKEKLVSHFDVDCINTVMSKSWYSKDLNRSLKWKVGQPLGYGPSFHLATLAHAVLLRNISGKPHVPSDKFMVVGDDVVICDSSLATDYQKTMSDIGVEINLQKSIISNKYAEFLGKLISIDGVNPSIKVRLMTNEDQYLDTLPFYGPSSLGLLDKFNRREYRWFIRNSKLPWDLGGLEWRNGQSYSSWSINLDQKKIRRSRIYRDLVNFTGLPHARLEDTLDTTIRFYSDNGYNMSPTEWQGFDAYRHYDGISLPTMNDLSDIPVSSHDKFFDVLKEVSGSYNTLTHVMDNMIAIEGHSLDSVLLGLRNGYISSKEKPFTRPIFDNKKGVPHGSTEPSETTRSTHSEGDITEDRGTKEIQPKVTTKRKFRY